MKKTLICGLLTGALLMSSVSASFSDIKNTDLAQTAAILSSLDIMNGVGGSSFAPERSLTRAEFSKLLVTALGVTDVTAYKNYTIFPDVPHTHWAAGYINAAVKHPDIKKLEVIHGYADGTFKPDTPITYGEACTMLLLMMGYTITDIGPMWPGDYIARAQSMELTRGTSVMTASSTVSRADAATMLLNTLMATGKDNAKLIDRLLGSGTENVILLATSETDSDLSNNQALFYIGEEAVKRTTDGILDKSLIGVQGTIYSSRTSTGTIQTMIPDRSGRTEEYTVKTTSNDKIETKEGTTVKPDRNTQVFTRGEIAKYSASWFDILPGDQIRLSYDAEGALRLISVGAAGEGNAFVYGTSSASAIPSGYKIVKNGVQVDASALKKYDVVSLDTTSKTALVSDKKISGVYDSGEPSFKNPEKITILGNTFAISESASSYFTNLKAGDRITLLLDGHGNVAGAYPVDDIRADMTGVLSQNEDQGTFITLFNGVTLKNLSTGELDKALLGRIVTLGQNSAGQPTFTARSMSGKATGTWSVETNLIGNRPVSPNVKVWEMVHEKAPVYGTSLTNLPTSIETNDIRYTVTDSAGSIIAVVLGDVTGDGWNYGFGYYSSESSSTQDPNLGEITNYNNTVTLKTWSDGGEKTLEYKVIDRPVGITGSPVGIPKGMENNTDKQFLVTKELIRVGTVKLTDFDTSEGVRTADGYYELADECGVYVTGQKKFVTLSQAKSDYTSFTLYADDKPENGGKIRMITVS